MFISLFNLIGLTSENISVITLCESHPAGEPCTSIHVLWGDSQLVPHRWEASMRCIALSELSRAFDGVLSLPVPMAEAISLLPAIKVPQCVSATLVWSGKADSCALSPVLWMEYWVFWAQWGPHFQLPWLDSEWTLSSPGEEILNWSLLGISRQDFSSRTVSAVNIITMTHLLSSKSPIFWTACPMLLWFVRWHRPALAVFTLCVCGGGGGCLFTVWNGLRKSWVLPTWREEHLLSALTFYASEGLAEWQNRSQSSWPNFLCAQGLLEKSEELCVPHPVA